MFNFVRAFGHSWKRRPLNSNCCQGIKGIHCVDEHLLAADLMSDIVWPDCYFQFATTVSKLKQSCGEKKWDQSKSIFNCDASYPSGKVLGDCLRGDARWSTGFCINPGVRQEHALNPKLIDSIQQLANAWNCCFFLHSVVPTILFDAPLLRQTRTRLDNFHVKLIGQMMFKVECHVLLLTWARLSNKEGRNTIMTNATIHPSQPANQQLSTPFNGWKTMLECKLSRDLDCEF